MQPRPTVSSESKTKLLDQVRHVLRLKHMSYRTEEAYVQWIKRFIVFHHKRHPSTMGAKAPGRIPVVLTQEEVAQVLSQLHGTPHLMASLLYGAGLRLMECVRLRVKDLDFPY